MSSGCSPRGRRDEDPHPPPADTHTGLQLQSLGLGHSITTQPSNGGSAWARLPRSETTTSAISGVGRGGSPSQRPTAHSLPEPPLPWCDTTRQFSQPREAKECKAGPPWRLTVAPLWMGVSQVGQRASETSRASRNPSNSEHLSGSRTPMGVSIPEAPSSAGPSLRHSCGKGHLPLVLQPPPAHPRQARGDLVTCPKRDAAWGPQHQVDLGPRKGI